MNQSKSMRSHILAKSWGMILFLMLLPLTAFAQNIKVEGTVTDATNGDPIIGATVKIKEQVP